MKSCNSNLHCQPVSDNSSTVVREKSIGHPGCLSTYSSDKKRETVFSWEHSFGRLRIILMLTIFATIKPEMHWILIVFVFQLNLISWFKRITINILQNRSFSATMAIISQRPSLWKGMWDNFFVQRVEECYERVTWEHAYHSQSWPRMTSTNASELNLVRFSCRLFNRFLVENNLGLRCYLWSQ